MPSNKASILEILALLESYERIHVEGNDCWKKALWNVYKGRHSHKRNNLGYVSETYCAASDVREDFDARITLNMSKDKGAFVRVEDGVEVHDEKNDQEEEIIAIATSESSNGQDDIPSLIPEKEGLRNRRQKPKTNLTSTNDGKKWTVEETNDIAPLELVDPLEMMAGACPSRELKEAQQRAKQAILCYIEAANILMQIQQKFDMI